MGNKAKGIILIVIALLIVGGLHQFIFAPIKNDYTQNVDELQRLQSKYSQIVPQLSNTSRGMLTGNAIATDMQQVIESINSQVLEDRKNFDALNQQLKIVEQFDSTRNYTNDILDEIERMKTLQQGSNVTKLTVLNSW